VSEDLGLTLFTTTRYSSVATTMITIVKIAGTNRAVGYDPWLEEDGLLF
jgi:hypothetical protein